MKLPKPYKVHQFSTASRSVSEISLFFILLFCGGQWLQARTTWPDASSTNWANSANWSAGVPDTADGVSIPNLAIDPDPINQSGTATLAKSVTINTSTALTTNEPIASVGTACNAGTITGTTTICQGITTQLSSNGGSGSWSSSNTAAVLINAPNGLMVGRAAGTSIISYTVTDGTCTSTATVVVTVNARPSAAIAITENNVSANSFTGLAYYNVSYTDGNLCTGPGFPNPTTNATLTASGGGTYLWSNSSTNNSITVSTAGTYTVVVTNAAGCANIASQTISVNSAPNAGTITATPNIPAINGGKGVCFGSTITLSSTVLGGEWSMFTGFQVVSVNSVTGLVTPIVNTNSTDTSSVRYQVSALGCVSGVLTQVEVLNSPSAGTISGNTNICSSPFLGNNTTQLSIIGGLSGGTWMSSNTSVATVNATGLVSAAPSTTNLGTSIISYTVTSGSCSSNSTAVITVNANPSALVTSTPFNTCVNQVVNVSVPDAGTGATYNWSGDIVNINNNATTSVSSTPGSKIYSVTVTAGNGCVNSGFGSHFLNALPVVNITANPNPVCIGLTLDLSVPMAASTTYAWSGLGLNSTTGSNVTATIPTAGMQTYSVTAQTNAFLGSCSNTGTVNVTASSPLACPSVFSPSNGQNAVALNIGMLDWNDVPGATGYVVSFGTNAPDYNNILNGATTASSQITITALSPNLMYGYKVTPTGACNASGCPTVIFSSCVPSFTCPANRDMALNSSCAMVIPDLVTGLAANPGCGSLTFTQNPTAGSIVASSHNGTVLVTITPNNTSVSSCAVTLTGKDLIAPTVTCKNFTTNLNAAGAASITTGNVFQSGTDNCGTVNQVSVTPNAFTCANLGTNTVVLTVNDGNGNTATCAATVTIADVTVPTVTCKNFTANLNAAGAASITTSNVFQIGADNCGTVNQVSVIPNAFTCANIGTNTVVLTVSDGGNNTATCVATVTVTDATAPTITCPANNIIRATDMNQCSASVVYPTPTAADNCGSAVVSHFSGGVSGAVFQRGTTTVIWRATDGAGLTSSCSFNITVNDTQKPNITCPANQTRSTDLNLCSAVVTYPAPIANDNCGLATGQPAWISGGTNAAGSTATFLKGATTVIWRATDLAGNTQTCTFRVTVNDTQAPTLACPAPMNINTTPNLCSAVATYTNPTFTDNCTPTTGTSTRISGLMSGSSFPAGNSNVVFQATDAAGNTRRCTMVVTVTDNQPPLITCPAPIVVNGSGTPCKATVFYSGATASDNCAGTLTPFLFTGLASGSMFPAGVTTNTFMAIAPNGQSADCSFTITVNCGSGMSNSGLEDRDKDLSVQSSTMGQKHNLELTLAPNPALSAVTVGIEGIGASGGTLLVFDAVGRLVLRQVIAEQQRTFIFQVDGSEFAPGLYRVNLTTENGMVTKTLVVIKE